MSSINRQTAIALVEQNMHTYRKIAPNMPEEAIVDITEIPYGWYFKMGMKNPSCSNLYYGTYTDYIVDKDYRFLHIVNSLDIEAEIVSYGEKRQKWAYRLWWWLTDVFKKGLIKGDLLILAFIVGL